MSIFFDLQSALESRLSTMTSLPPVAWPNVGYEPDAGILFLRPNHIPVSPTKIGTADNDKVRRDGFYQIDVFAPKNSGTGVANKKADEVYSHFPIGLELLTATDGYKIRIDDVSIDVGDIAGAHYAVPVLIRYHAVTN